MARTPAASPAAAPIGLDDLSSDILATHSTESAMARTPAASPTAAPIGLYDLPQKVRGKIFDLAYGHQLDGEIYHKSRWNRAERRKHERSGGTYMPRPFPSHKVDEWLVSKKYFLEAAKAWMNAQYFDEMSWAPWSNHISIQLLRHSDLFLAFGRSVVLNESHLGTKLFLRLAECQSLSYVAMAVTRLSERGAKAAERKQLREEELDDDHLMKAFRRTGLHALRGLENLHFEIFHEHHRGNEVFQRNIARLNTLARDFASEPRVAAESATDVQSLYHKSLVRWGDKISQLGSTLQFAQQNALFENKAIIVKLPGFPERESRSLFDLPQKVLDQIFGLVYGRQQEDKLWFKLAWKKKDKEEKSRMKGKRKKHWEPLPFPPHKVNDWMVSKRYFREAARSWMTAQDFDHMACDHLEANVSQYLLGQGGLFLEFGRSVVLKLEDGDNEGMLHRLSQCQSLRSVVLTVEVYTFKTIADMRPWAKRLDDQVLLGALEASGLLRLRVAHGLENFELQAVRTQGSLRKPKVGVFEENVARLSTLARASVQAVGNRNALHDRRRLQHRGSRVHYDKSLESQVSEHGSFIGSKALPSIQDITETQDLRLESSPKHISDDEPLI